MRIKIQFGDGLKWLSEELDGVEKRKKEASVQDANERYKANYPADAFADQVLAVGGERSFRRASPS